MRSRTGPRVAGLALVLLCGAVLALIAPQQGAAGSWLPHGYCFTWNPTLLWTHVVSDALIGAAYVTIPVTLVHLVRRRADLPFNWIVVLFAVFILSCGATHWIEVWTVWNPDYWLSANVKVVTAAASVLTAAALVGLAPKILAIPTVAQLSEAKAALELEVQQRRRAEEALLNERAQLEQRVLERTEALAEATRSAAAARAAADEANQLKDRFLAKVSHELRTPLQSTLTWAQLLHRNPEDPARALQASDRIMHNVRTQARLIDDLLDISRILSGKLSLDIQPTNAAQVIQKAVDVVRSAAGSRGMTIELQGVDEEIILETDAVRLEQVAWNLVNNAVQASQDGGRVQARLSTPPGVLVLEVQDWGRGIDPADLPHIFEPFHQAPGSRNAHRGLGLGLAITRSVVELFGGELSAHSDGLGQGATFTMRLPLAAGPGAKVQPETLLSPEERRRLQGLRVLYVEDEPDIAEGGRLMLAALGAEVTLALSFEQACEHIAAGGFDVFLSDLNLGGGRTALELIPLLRGAPGLAGVPAIVLSAYGTRDDLEASLKAGFATHLVKPAQAEDVARAVLAALAALGPAAGPPPPGPKAG
jgi:signal transduction histidine kinase/ActR/RegA family two-component response regulator